MNTDIRTPELAQAASALSALLEAADKGIADATQGKLVIGASNGMCRVVKTDLERRLSAGKLAAIEAKAVEAVQQKKITAAA